ncbi:hypothetical protein MNBD_GAMMA26-725 [hydrothermal vent metagenome]|uniref:Glutamine amidotransferase domain-containing protein n=1 Tax=hydrothermal vent metagenome TaxID=652676 RepID=A0A3B1BAT1_9ZZZZ
MFREFFSKHVSHEWDLVEYAVSQSRWPGSMHDCDGWIIGGSPKSVYDRHSWIMKLMEFACACHYNKKPLLGICFGHQVIAQCLGGGVHKSLNGWNIGVRSIKMRNPRVWMSPSLEHCSLLYSHQDEVKMPPDGAVLLGGDAHFLHQAYAIGDHIFGIQGHPEFTPEFLRLRLEALKESLTEAEYQEALSTLERPTDSAVVGGWIRQFFG